MNRIVPSRIQNWLMGPASWPPKGSKYCALENPTWKSSNAPAASKAQIKVPTENPNNAPMKASLAIKPIHSSSDSMGGMLAARWGYKYNDSETMMAPRSSTGNKVVGNNGATMMAAPTRGSPTRTGAKNVHNSCEFGKTVLRLRAGLARECGNQGSQVPGVRPPASNTGTINRPANFRGTGRVYRALVLVESQAGGIPRQAAELHHAPRLALQVLNNVLVADLQVTPRGQQRAPVVHQGAVMPIIVT